MVLFDIDLTAASIVKEEGVIKNDKNKSIWLFKIEAKSRTHYFGVNCPKRYEEWYQTIFKITETHRKLVCYDHNNYYNHNTKRFVLILL